MYRRLLTLISLILIFFPGRHFAQVITEIEGVVRVANTTDPTPDAGTIRWTGSDFEGYNGTQWITLTALGVTDLDGNIYKIVRIGSQTWIAENLKTTMYAQSDVQRNRRYYLGNTPMYEDFEPFWEQSPLKYIKNAKTPTMIHVVAGDPRVPSPQSVELHMALKKLGVDTELFMYPGKSHGIPDTRNRLVKAVSEMAWMDYYVRGKGEKFLWQQVLQTLEEEGEEVEEVDEDEK